MTASSPHCERPAVSAFRLKHCPFSAAPSPWMTHTAPLFPTRPVWKAGCWGLRGSQNQVESRNENKKGFGSQVRRTSCGGSSEREGLTPGCPAIQPALTAGYTPGQGFSTPLPASSLCLQVTARLRLWRPRKEFGPERVSAGGWGREGPGSAHLGCEVHMLAWLTGLHSDVRHAKGQGLLLRALQQSL